MITNTLQQDTTPAKNVDPSIAITSTSSETPENAVVDTSATPETSEIASTEIVNVNFGENVVATIETTTVELPTAEESAE